MVEYFAVEILNLIVFVQNQFHGNALNNFLRKNLSDT